MKRATSSLLRSSGQMRAPEVASAAAETYGPAGERRRDRGGLQPPSHWSLLVTGRRKRHPAAPADVSTPGSTSLWNFGSRQGKQLVKSFNFYDTKTVDRVRGIGGTGPKINITLQTVNKASCECKTCYLYSNQYYYFLA